MGGPTRPNLCFRGKEGAKVLPLGRVAVHRPTFADFGDGEAVEEVGGRAVDVREDAAMGFGGRSHGVGCVAVVKE